jgi:hypothetical protein
VRTVHFVRVRLQPRRLTFMSFISVAFPMRAVKRGDASATRSINSHLQDTPPHERDDTECSDADKGLPRLQNLRTPKAESLTLSQERS